MPWWLWILLLVVVIFLVGQMSFQRGKATFDSFVASHLALAESAYEGVRADYAAGRLNSSELHSAFQGLADIMERIRDEAKARGIPHHPGAADAADRINRVYMSDIGLLVHAREIHESQGLTENQRREAPIPEMRRDSTDSRFSKS